jgi:uncharacterized protein YukE
MLLLNTEEPAQVTMLCMMEILANMLHDRTEPKTRRWNRIQALKEHIEKVNETYQGYLPDEFVEKAEGFYQEIEKSIVALLTPQGGES